MKGIPTSSPPPQPRRHYQAMTATPSQQETRPNSPDSIASASSARIGLNAKPGDQALTPLVSSPDPSLKTGSRPPSIYKNSDKKGGPSLPFTYSGVFDGDKHVWKDVPSGSHDFKHPSVSKPPLVNGSLKRQQQQQQQQQSNLSPMQPKAFSSSSNSSPCSVKSGTSESLASSDTKQKSEKKIDLSPLTHPDQYLHKDNFDPTNPDYVPNGDPYSQEIYLSEEDITIRVEGMTYNNRMFLLFNCLTVLTCGLLALVCSWLPKWRIKMTMKKCSLENAKFVLVSDIATDSIALEKVSHRFFGGPLGSIFGALTLHGPFAAERNAIVNHLSSFTFRYYRFMYHPLLKKFIPNYTWRAAEWLEDPDGCRKGLNYETKEMRHAVFGDNMIGIEDKSVLSILISEALNPFYIFQIFSIVLWMCDDYYVYASCILLMSIISITSTLLDTRRNIRRINEMARFSCSVNVFRERMWRRMESSDLLPGDVFEVSDPGLLILPCDALLLEGDCIVNESMLTGESIPVAKTPTDKRSLMTLDPSDTMFQGGASKHVLFSGTKLVRVKKTGAGFGGRDWIELEKRSRLDPSSSDSSATGYTRKATAMVIRSGFNTTKGALVRSIMFPRPNKFKFYQDSMRFVGVLAVIAVIGFFASLSNFVRLGVSSHIIIMRALDLITVVVPPALPATMSIGISFALARLRRRRIFCISPMRINIAGKLNVACFDKTGTLTEDGLDVLGAQAISAKTQMFGEMTKDVSLLSTQEAMGFQVSSEKKNIQREPNELMLIHALASCHSLKLVHGELLGDPLDVRMFESTQWVLEEGDDESHPESAGLQHDNTKAGGNVEQRLDVVPNTHIGPVPSVVRPPFAQEFSLDSNSKNYELGILRTFEFSPALRRMSVVTKLLNSRYMEAYVKGAPEAISELCDKNTLPKDFKEKLDAYTHNGYRVIAIAGKTLKISWPKLQHLSRADIESNLIFLGFIVFENRLKPTSAPVLKELREASIRQIMCTGDNVLTAVSVARSCGMVVPSLRVFYPKLVAHEEQRDSDAPAEILWQDIDGSDTVLDPMTLKPVLLSPDGLQRQADLELESANNYCVAVTGDVFRRIIDEYPTSTINRMLMRGIVYARMSPDEKGELIEKLQGLEYSVCFCGDGANDCSALKAADVGISLSEADASVAAPFVSQSTDIYCVLDVIRDGRAALVTSFGCFKYMALYSIIQFVSVSLMYSYGGGLGDYQFLYIDLFIILPIAVFMSNSPSYKKIVRKSPTANLMSSSVITSLIGQGLIMFVFQLGMFNSVRRQPWYSPPVMDPDTDVKTGNFLILTYENTCVFLVSCFQYICVACVLNKGPPYRRTVFKNIGFIASCAILFGITIYLAINPAKKLRDILELEVVPMNFRIFIVGYSAANYLASFLCEKWVFPMIVPMLSTGWQVSRGFFSHWLSQIRSSGLHKYKKQGKRGDISSYSGSAWDNEREQYSPTENRVFLPQSAIEVGSGVNPDTDRRNASYTNLPEQWEEEAQRNQGWKGKIKTEKAPKPYVKLWNEIGRPDWL
ncbi:hypothetical protein H4219_000617 [Mycoemilia scoparia]|uniref:Cation-transporting ATPase n=1 Tax=Mycoemilia scoparia TaxID=417184 RepID=A0A9W8A2L1_9FUNG|nr:hypothetical protein H4219_000617 [Mycoemilia scoparia]